MTDPMGVDRDRTAATHAGRITRARRDAGLSQREFADLVGTSLWTIDELESGRVDSHRYSSRIEAVLGKPPGWIVDGGDDREDSTAVSAPASGSVSSDRLGRNLVLFVLVTILTVRFFTQQVGVLPSGGNFIDVLLLPFLGLAVILRSQRQWMSSAKGTFNGELALLAMLFMTICTISMVLNTSRVAPGPVLLFLYGFLGPIGFYFATHRLWPRGQATALSRTLVAVGVLQFAVILVFDLPTFLATRNPDEIAGTFGGNAYQLVFYLLLFAALVAGIATFERRAVGRFAPVLLGATFLTIFLAQYRALLATTALTVVFVGVVLSRFRSRGFAMGALAITAFVVGLGYVAVAFPTTKFSPTIAAARNDPALFLTARLTPARDVLALYGDDPRFIVTGTGPGTYSSRAWVTFASVGRAASAEGAAQPYAGSLTGGESYHTDVADKYVVPRIREGPAILGSRAISSPNSSYLALLAETGVLGFALVVAMYALGLVRAGSMLQARARERRLGDPLPALLLATMVAFFVLLQMAFIENWLEVARVTVPAWMLLAVCTKELESAPAERVPA